MCVALETVNFGPNLLWTIYTYLQPLFYEMQMHVDFY